MIIAVCGNIASGKTLLLIILVIITASPMFLIIDQNYLFLKDFFEDIPEKFLQTQLAFLSNKASQIHSFKVRKKYCY